MVSHALATLATRRRFASAILVLTLLSGAAVAAEDAAAPPVAVAARLVEDGETAKLSFDLSGPVEASAHAMADPDRIVVDLAEVNFQLDPAVGRAAPRRSDPIVKAFRFGLFGPGKSRVVIDLARPACVGKVETTSIAEGSAPTRLVIELKRCEASAFASGARLAEAGAASAPAPPEEAAAGPGSGPPVIVIDPGHGGVDGGAYGVGGAVEKTLVYDYALELERRLEAKNRFKVVLTRHGDEFVSLEDRVRIAREANAALFVSIHADALGGTAADVSGATVYTCSERASDAEAARIAERENAADKTAGVEQKAEAAGVADILLDLKRRETRAYAHIFSRGVVEQWQGVARLNRNPERSAGFVVLKAPDFPSVLVELGYLSNAQDVQSLSSADWRAKTASAMANAIDRFFAPARSVAERAPKTADAVAASDKSTAAEPAKPGNPVAAAQGAEARTP
ncbi:MAG: N-acetylmuramoyl-L-alanine amidase [Roseiarcus sp.]|jgi:N-acetylmuramoyl-L-alanine amidase